MRRGFAARWPSGVSAAVALVVVALLGHGAPALAAGPPRGDRPLPDIDARSAAAASVPGRVRQARAALRRALGAQGVVATDRSSGATRLVARRDGFLNARSARAAEAIALDYVLSHQDVFGLDAGDLRALRLTSRYRSPGGVTHLAWVQTRGGVAAFDSVLFAAVTDDGRLVNAGGSALPDLGGRSLVPSIDAATALASARREIGAPLLAPRAQRLPGAELPTHFTGGDRARLTLVRDGDTVRLAWRVVAEGAQGFLYELVVDATSGDVLLRRSLTDFVSNARVYDRYPGAATGGSPRTVDLDADPTWLNRSAGGTRLAGNNAHAYADTAAPSGVDAGEDVGVNPASGDWVYPLTPVSAPGQPCPTPGCTWNSANPATKAVNRAQVTTQLFYFVNTFHDHLEAAPIGFTHAARGFEFADADGGGPGLGGDPVNAEANDFSETNNASMTTPPDGQAPRLQMHFFGPPGAPASLNAGDNADIVYHEYAHGLTSRSVGTGQGIFAAQTQALGEGWSDWYALDFLAEQGLVSDSTDEGEMTIGGYLLNAFGTGGFRRQGLDCSVRSSSPACPGTTRAGAGGFTFGDLGKVGNGFQVHDDGEIWGETLWDLRRALGTDTARALITEGMRLAPDDPSFLEARDAIIQADQALFDGDNHSALWGVFAARGMGFSASTGSSQATSALEKFDRPPVLAHESSAVSDAAPGGDGDGIVEPGETVSLDETLRNPNPSSITDISGQLSSSLPGVGVPQASASWSNLAAGATGTGSPSFRVTVPASLRCGATIPLALGITTAQGSVTLPLALRTGTLGATALSSDVPKPIPASGAFVSSALTLSGAGTVDGLKLRIASLTHSFVGDLVMTLQSPSGTVVSLMENPGLGTFGAQGDNLDNLLLDDDSRTPIASLPQTGLNYSGSYRPDQPLSAFDGEPRAGTWILRVRDDFAAQDTGTLNSWGLIPAARCPGEGGEDPGPEPAPSGPGGAGGSGTGSPALTFGGASKTLRVSRSGRFTYRFRGTPSAGGSVRFTSRKPVGSGLRRRTVRLGRKSFSLTATGRAAVSVKLSRRNLSALKRARSVRFSVTVTLAGRAFKTTLTLKAPKRGM